MAEISYPRFQRARDFKRVRRVGGGNYVLVQSSFVSSAVFDATNFGFQVLYCDVGDLIELDWSFQCFATTTSVSWAFTFEVDQPTSANVFTDADATFPTLETIDTNRRWRTIRAFYPVTEIGSHGFRPALRASSTSANSLTVANASSGADGTPISFVAKNLGPQDPN